MNIYNKNWAQYEYSYNLANSRENWAQKKKISLRVALALVTKLWPPTPQICRSRTVRERTRHAW